MSRHASLGKLTFLAVALAALNQPALAQPFDVPVDTAQSVLTFELCVSGTCDADTANVAGHVTVELDSIDAPAQIWLHDLDLDLTSDLHLQLSWGVLGNLNAWGYSVGLLYAGTGPTGPVPVTGGAFAFVDVPADMEGALQYTSSGIPCAALQALGYPCSDTRNLADEGTHYGNVDGTVTSVNRVVTLVSNIDVTSPLDPTSPNLGYFRIHGTVRGEVYVPIAEGACCHPDGSCALTAEHACTGEFLGTGTGCDPNPCPPAVCPGDSNCDGSVSWRDIDYFVAAMNDNVTAWEALFDPGPPTCEFANNDVNGDGTVTWRDIDSLVALMNTTCP